jgi:hypothetical protein
MTNERSAMAVSGLLQAFGLSNFSAVIGACSTGALFGKQNFLKLSLTFAVMKLRLVLARH